MEALLQQSKIEFDLRPVKAYIEPGGSKISQINPPFRSSPFIEANTMSVNLAHLKQECIIPVFSKDNEKTIAHQEFVDIAYHSIQKVFQHQEISLPEIRVSHQVKGRTPDAIHKPAIELLDHEKTIYYERMAFIYQIPTIVDFINGNELMLTIGGVRSYNLENLYSRKSYEKFKFFIGFQNKVCCNLCISTDGLHEEIKVLNIQDLQKALISLMKSYNMNKQFYDMKDMSKFKLSESQFAKLIGRAKLYQHISKEEKTGIPILQYNDTHINSMAKDYYEDKRFCRDETGDINLWNVYNLMTSANKNSYIDSFLGRNANALGFSLGLTDYIKDNGREHWFMS